MPESLTIALGQQNFMVGDCLANANKLVKAAVLAAEQGADMFVSSELALIGYPPEDLLLRPSLQERIEQALAVIAEASHKILIVVGYPWRQADTLTNRAGVWHKGQCIAHYDKQCLPNYQVFDEQRYFHAGEDAVTFNYHGHTIGLLVCEDAWHKEPVAKLASQNATLIVTLNASPYHQHKATQRHDIMSQHCNDHGLSMVYVNSVGGQDELVFDGASFVLNQQGQSVMSMPLFKEMTAHVCLQPDNTWQASSDVIESQDELATLYHALTTGLRDYVDKNGFKGVALGLSGGIDSALSLAIAVDALGVDRVLAVMMPFTYTSSISREDAEQQAKRMGVSYRSISIERMYQSFIDALAHEFSGLSADTTEENLQSRCRGVLLMALSNKLGYMVLTTGNKSEMAVGYATLYGDMVGGFNALKDVYKTRVFELARWRNQQADGEVIPDRVITRPPSAELAPDQKDEDSLPPYEQLDAILSAYIDHDQSAHDIIARGFEAQIVNRVLTLVDRNEYKRRQAPVGVRVSERAFGRDRRYPMTNGWPLGR